MTTDPQTRAAKLIWETSRADEGTISATGANIAAAALAEAGLLEVHPGDFVRVETAEKYRDERDAARAELATVREEWAKTENALYAARAELAQVERERDMAREEIAWLRAQMLADEKGQPVPEAENAQFAEWDADEALFWKARAEQAEAALRTLRAKTGTCEGDGEARCFCEGDD